MSNSEAGVVLGCVGIIALAAALGALFAWIAALLYNGILVPTFGMPPLTFWQMWGIIIFINLVFGGLRVSKSSSK